MFFENCDKKDGTADGGAVQELAGGRHSMKSAETGSHIARLFAERQRERKASYALVFVDAIAAFYSVHCGAVPNAAVHPIAL